MSAYIDPDVLQILNNSQCSDNRLYLPPVQLDRKLYLATNEVITRLGGKWVGGKVKAHVFENDQDADALRREVCATGLMPPKNPLAFWPTPPVVIAQMLEIIDTTPTTVLEPSAGDGAIVAAILERWPAAQVTAIELDQRRADKLRAQQPRATVHAADFLTWRPPHLFDAVLMNPPFAVSGDPLAYIAHICHAFEHVAPGGQLIAIAPAGLEFRTDKRTRGLRELAQRHGVIKALPQRVFEASGTMVSTIMLTMKQQGARETDRVAFNDVPTSQSVGAGARSTWQQIPLFA